MRIVSALIKGHGMIKITREKKAEIKKMLIARYYTDKDTKDPSFSIRLDEDICPNTLAYKIFRNFDCVEIGLITEELVLLRRQEIVKSE